MRSRAARAARLLGARSALLERAPRLTSRLSRVRRLAWRDRWLLLQAGLLLPLISLSLKVVTFQRAYGALLRLTPATARARRSASATGSTRVLQVARVVAMAGRHTSLPNTCLHRALALWWLLRRRGFDSRLRFGARKQDGGFEAHAWVEHDGIVVFEDLVADRDYVRLSWQPVEHDA
jgi:hypothetical protein